jgi:hypothetical protein
MKSSWKIRMARNAVHQSKPAEVIALVDAVLPAVVETLPKAQLKIFIKRLFHNHLELLMHDLNREERAALLRDVLPVIARVFPLEDVDLAIIDTEEFD